MHTAKSKTILWLKKLANEINDNSNHNSNNFNNTSHNFNNIEV